MKGRFIIIVPYHFEFFKCFKENLQQIGYEVSLLFVTDRPFKYKKISQKIYNLIQKSVFRNKAYKENLRVAQNGEELIKTLSEINTPVDYALVIRADFLNAAAISSLKEKSKKIFAYQWDGYKRSPAARKLIHLFDSFFVFDTDDYKLYSSEFPNIKFITNFYLDNIYKSDASDGTVFFIGRYLEERTTSVFRITEFFREKGIKTNVNIVVSSKRIQKRIKSDGINVLKEPLSYSSMLEHLKSASYILDFENAEQNGLTFRVFESLFFQKKLITNNALVAEYDFYHPNNIFVWNENNIDELEAFLYKPYKKLNEEIVKKYSFTNWLKNIIEEQPYSEINAPGRELQRTVKI